MEHSLSAIAIMLVIQIQGTVFLITSCMFVPISRQYKAQHSIMLSSTKAEWVSISNAAKEICSTINKRYVNQDKTPSYCES